MASEDAKTLTHNKKGMLDLLLEQERFNKFETIESFGILGKDGGNGGISDNMGSLGTKDVIFGNIGTEVENGVSVVGCEVVGESGEEVNGVFCKDSGNRGVYNTIDFLGTGDVIKGNCRDDGGKCVDGEIVEAVGMGVEVEKGIRVGRRNVEEMGVYDNKGYLGTEDANGGNYIYGGGKFIEAGKGGVLDKANDAAESLISEGVSSVLEKDTGIGGHSESMGLLGTDNANKGNCGDDGDKCIGVADNGGALDMELVVDSGISVDENLVDSDKMDEDGTCIGGVKKAKVTVGSCFSENNLEKINMNGITLVVEISDDEHLAVSDKVEGEKVENHDDGENVYKVGDFVWGKFNSHPWWPAQIYDPSDASDLARKRRPNGNPLLVAYFGDGTFLWRSPDQLKPFSENFDELSKKNDSIIFLTAVKDALYEIGRVAELKMCCECISEERKDGLEKEVMVNAGIKKGATVTQCDFERLPISDFEPLELLAMVKSMALGDNGINMLELTGIKSFFSAFYRAKCARKLDSCCHEGLVIEGIGEAIIRGSSGGNELGSVLRKCDNLKDSKKRKSVVKSIVKGSGEKKIKSVGEFATDGVLSAGDVVKAVDGNVVGAFEQDNGEVNASRKRKKSKYLSFPFTDPSTSVKMMRLKRDSALETVKISKKNAGIGDKMITAATKLNQSSAVLMNNLFEKSETGGDIELKASPEVVVSKARSAAIDPQIFFESNSGAVVNDFIRAYRKVAYSNGSNIKPLSKKRENKTSDEIITLSEIKRESKKNKRVKKNADGMGNNNEGLFFIKEKLESLSKMVESCDGDGFAEMKPNMETKINGILEKVNGMLESA